MLKNLTRYAKHLVSDGGSIDDGPELEYVQQNHQRMLQIAYELCNPTDFKKHNFKVEELAGGMKTPTSVTEIQAQVQV